MKTSKRWNYLKSQLQTSKGFWYVPPQKNLILKVYKQQDHLHRRFFLKPLKFAENNLYLSHEKRLAQVETNKKMMIRLSYCQDSPINKRLSLRKKSQLLSPLNIVQEERFHEEIKECFPASEEELQGIKETILEDRLSDPHKLSQELSKDSDNESFEIKIKKDIPSKQEVIEVDRLSNIREFITDQERIKEARLKMIPCDSQNTFTERKSNDYKAFISSSNEELENSYFNNDEVITKIKEVSVELGMQQKTNSIDFQGLNRIQSEKLMEKKKENYINNIVINRSATKVAAVKQRRKQSKNALIKKSRNLQFSHIDLMKFSDKEVEKLEIEMREQQNIFLRDSSKKAPRHSLKYTQERIQQYFAEKISLKGGHYGQIEITKDHFIFRALGCERPDNGPTSDSNFVEPPEGDILYDLFTLGIDQKQLLTSHCKKQWNLSEIIGVQGRSYNLRACAFEVFTLENKAYFFNVYDPKIAEEIIAKLQKLKKNKVDFFYNRAEGFKNSGIQDKWLKGLISNFEYLSLVNTYAGRTYNDINQYPVFPWILTDYKSSTLDLSNPAIFRNLSLPVGALLKHRLEEAREHYDTLSQSVATDLFDRPFHYGTHYSGLGPVSYFLIRLEPFTTEHIKLQSGNFDDTDRLFGSIPQSWEICLERDFKELLPEMYYLPDFLMNKNGFDFGKGNQIGSVELPAWARSPYEFVFRHREALESDYVSKNIHNWIDLIFGYKQKGKNAFEADNVFRELTYEDAVNLTTIQDPAQRKNYLEYITKLGQTPHQLFTHKHPCKTSVRFDDKTLFKIPPNLGNIEKFECIFDASVVKMAFSSSEIMMFFNNNYISFTPFDDMNILIDKKKVFQISAKISSNEFSQSSHVYFFKKKKRTVILGGYYDGSFSIFVKGKEIKKNDSNSNEFLHKKPIACIGVCEECKIIACGSKDCRISLWKYDKDMGFRIYTEAGGSGLIYGHNNEIITLKINEIFDILISVDKDGIVLIHEIRKGRFLRKIVLEMERDEYANHLDIHDNGLILIATTLSRIFIYRFKSHY